MLNLIRAIYDVYHKHGWTLRYVHLLEATHRDFAAQLGDKFAGVPIEIGDLNAMWFSRASGGGREAWELRLISEKPFAMFETFDDKLPEAEKEAVRRKSFARLQEKVKNKN